MRLLGFHQLLELIAGYVQSPAGRKNILSLQPAADLAVIQAQRGLYEDLLKLEESIHSLPGLQAEEMGAILLQVQPADAVLDGMSLLQCGRQLQVAADVLDFGQRAEVQELPRLSALIGQLNDCGELRMELNRSLDVDGSVLDSATPRLREIRRNRSETERRLQRVLEGMIHGANLTDVLQERFVTQRQGRYVVPVKREAQRAIPGLVHDVSSTGQTLFVEPMETLPLGNAISALDSEEREEVRRILATLSAGVRKHLEDIRRNERLLGRLDAAAAVAHWAAEYSCRLPVFGGTLRLQQARHPLLLAQFRREGKNRTVVPLELNLPQGTKTLAVTGSNTGGKTVTLKTVGLIVLAAQSGLPVPVGVESVFEIFDHVLADIGDEQSLAESLSTFSGHLSNISEIFQTTQQGRSLVLLDELGSGTDPVEGGALACAILKELAGRRTLTIATTHLGTVKNFVHVTQGMINAAVRFNADTLEPEYVLDIGRPGASHALTIARRLGVPNAVLKSAEGFLTGEELRLEDLLSKMDKEHRELVARNAAAEASRKAAEEEREQLRLQLADLKKHRKQLLNEAFKQADAMVDNTRRNLEHLVQEIREQAKQQPGAGNTATAGAAGDEVSSKVAAARQEIAAQGKRVAEGLKRTAPTPSQSPLKTAQMRVGAKIWVERLGAHGRIVRLDPRGKEVGVDVNGVAFTLKTREIFPAQPEAEKETAEKKPGVAVLLPRFEGQTSHEINLVGLRVDDAILQLSTYLNQCVMAHLGEVRVVHGFGTGRLKAGIQQWLQKQPFVKSYRTGVDQKDTGGGGVTWVTLS